MSITNPKKHERAATDDDFDDGEDEDSMKDRYLSFRLAEEEYGIDIQFVTEIVGIQRISAVPEMPTYIKGVINLRGQVIPIMDVRARFHMPEQAYNERTCVIVVNMNENFVGLVVDAVREVASLPQDSICEAPRVARSQSAQYIKGIGKVGEDVKIILDVYKLVSDSAISNIKSGPAA